MGETTGIEWTDHTANFWEGCTKYSPGCANCYADNRARRWGLNVWGPKSDRLLHKAVWTDVFKWQKAAAAAGVRRRVFTLSLGDIFEGPETCQIPAAYEMIQEARARIWPIVEQTPNLDWLMLTKRPQNIKSFVPASWMSGGFPPNVFPGTSCENQEEADKRIAEIVKVPARLAFLSIEPLLGSLKIGHWLHLPPCPQHPGERAAGWGHLPCDCRPFIDQHAADRKMGKIGWVIVGGESGPGARPMHPDWIRSLRDECVTAGVPFFFKQYGEWLGYQEAGQAPFWVSPRGDEIDGHIFPDFSESPSPEGWDADTHMDVVYRRVGKKSAGRLLDGRTWSEFPKEFGGD